MGTDNNDSDDEDVIRSRLAELEKKLMAKERQKRQSEAPSTPEKPKRHKSEVQVGGSPERSITQSPKSPARVTLGLEKKYKAKDIKLRRKPSIPGSGINPQDKGGQPQKQQPVSSSQEHRPKSFADRMTQHKSYLEDRTKVKQEIQSKRVHSFGSVSQQDIDLGKGVEYEGYSKLRLAKRLIQTDMLDKELSDKKVYLLAHLFATVKPPHFDVPDDPNYVVIGIVCRKSEIKFNKMNGKFMMLTLTDLVDDVSVVVAGEALEKYFKVGEGTVVAVLNPGFFIQSLQGGTKSFGLKISTEFESILPIGMAKDFGYCSAITARGTQCSQWVNKHRNERCEFHTNLGLNRARNKRQELNSAPTRTYNKSLTVKMDSDNNAKTKKGGSASSAPDYRNKNGLLPTGPAWDLQDGNRGRIYTSTASKIGFDTEDQVSPAELKRLQAKRAKMKEQEEVIRQKLAKRPEGYLLRDFDDKGQMIQTPEDMARLQQLHGQPRLFTPEQVRKLGFDPIKRDRDAANQKDKPPVQVIKGGGGSSSSQNQSQTQNDSDDSDDLEIV